MMVVRHRPSIEQGADDYGATYRMCCTCGQQGEAHASRRLAQYDLDSHVSALPRVPVYQQCRDRRAHDRRPWEPCATCAGQMSLF
ncbi:hypothetical protein [Actinomadura miaoliensis]